MPDIKRTDARIVCIIQARMGSSRLPGKVLEEICGSPMIEWVVQRASRSASINAVVVATSVEKDDEAIAEWCVRRGVPVHRGSALDVLDRFYQTALAENADVVVRLTADCPLVDPTVIDDVIDEFFVTKADFAANRLPPPYHRTFPIGLDVEVVSFEALDLAWKNANQHFEREHVLPYLYGREGRFKVSIVDAQADYGDFRWTVDTPQDLHFIRALMQGLQCDRDVGWLDILTFIQKHPEIAAINADVHHKSFTDIDHRAKNDSEEKHA